MVDTPIHRELRYFIKIISAIAVFPGVTFFLVSVAIGNGTILRRSIALVIELL